MDDDLKFLEAYYTRYKERFDIPSVKKVNESDLQRSGYKPNEKQRFNVYKKGHTQYRVPRDMSFEEWVRFRRALNLSY